MDTIILAPLTVVGGIAFLGFLKWASHNTTVQQVEPQGKDLKVEVELHLSKELKRLLQRLLSHDDSRCPLCHK